MDYDTAEILNRLKKVSPKTTSDTASRLLTSVKNCIRSCNYKITNKSDNQEATTVVIKSMLNIIGNKV